MKLSLSVRVAEKFLAKREANMTLQQLASLAAQHGYDALCMRASQVGVHSPPEAVAAARTMLAARRLPVSVLTGASDLTSGTCRTFKAPLLTA